jgi:hypothetical protein
MTTRSIPSRIVLAAAGLGAALALSACADTRKAIGWDKVSPDEFNVVTRAPLTLPPDFGLRPPAPGTARPQEQSPTEQARVAVFGNTAAARNAAAGQQGPGSTGEHALVSKTGGDKVEANIREQLDRETSQLAEADRSFVDRLMFWRANNPGQGEQIDATRESQRLREAAATGRPASDGSVATVRKRQRGWLEGIF